jgi:hypothetical protein
MCFLVMSALVTIIVGCAGKPQPAAIKTASAVQDSAGETVNVTLKGADISWDDGKGRKVMDARFAEFSASGTEARANAELRNMRADLYQDGKIASTLIAPRVTVDSGNREIHATGGVQIKSVTGASVTANEIVWRSRENKVEAKGPVKVSIDNITIDAKGFEADTALKHAKFSGAEANIK